MYFQVEQLKLDLHFCPDFQEFWPLFLPSCQRLVWMAPYLLCSISSDAIEVELDLHTTRKENENLCLTHSQPLLLIRPCCSVPCRMMGFIKNLKILTCSWHQKPKTRTVQFTNLKCCIKARKLFKALVNGVLFLIYYLKNILSPTFSF